MSYIYTESQDSRNLSMCKEIGEYLALAYPGHSWHVRIDGGCLIIKNMAVSLTAGMVRHIRDIDHDATRRKHEIIMAAGEFLEAAHMRRAAYQGGIAKILEGLPKGQKFKPILPPTLSHLANE